MADNIQPVVVDGKTVYTITTMDFSMDTSVWNLPMTDLELQMLQVDLDKAVVDGKICRWYLEVFEFDTLRLMRELTGLDTDEV